MALAISAAMGSAEGMTPSERRPSNVPFGVAKLGDLLLQGAPVVENRVRPLEHALAFGRKPVEALAALDDRHAELLLELAEAPRKGRLRHIAGLGRAREVLLTRKRDEVLELADIHRLRASIAADAGRVEAAD